MLRIHEQQDAPAPIGHPGAFDEVTAILQGALTLQDIAERLNISLRQVQAHVDDGSLVAVNVGRGTVRRDLRVLENDLEGFLLRRRTALPRIATFPEARPQRPPVLPPKPDYAQRRAARMAGKRV